MYLINNNGLDKLAQYYPAGNFFPSSPAAVGFVDYAKKDFRLATNSKYKGRSKDGTDPGIDLEALRAALPASELK